MNDLRLCKTTWEDIPPEVLENILCRLDLSSLLSLSKMNRLLNRMALFRYFGPQKLRELQRAHTFHLDHSDGRQELVHAFRVALWIKDIRHIDCLLRTPHESRQFSGVIEASSLKLETLSLTLSGRLMENICSQRHLDPWTSVVEAAFSQGCKSLILKCHPVNSEDKRRFDSHIFGYSERSSRKQFSSWFRRHVLQQSASLYPSYKSAKRLDLHAPIHSARSMPACLEELMIDSPSLQMNPLVSSYLHSIFQRQAAAIRRLSIGGSTYVCDEAWDQLFKMVVLPVLESLRIDFSMQSLKLISRHRSLTYLEINELHSFTSKRLPEPLLPNLTYLDAFPETVSFFLSAPNTFPKLQFIRMIRQVCPTPPLNSVIRALHSIVSTHSTKPLHITVAISLPERTIDYSSLRSQLSPEHSSKGSLAGHRSPNPQRVVELILDVRRSWWMDDAIVQGGLEDIVSWISQFRSLKALYVNDIIFHGWDINKRFCDGIVAACPHLDVFYYGSGMVKGQEMGLKVGNEPSVWKDDGFMMIRKGT